MHFLNFEVFLSYRISRIFCRRCFDYKIIMIIILRLKRELCPGGIRTHRCIRKIQPKLSPIIFFSRFIQMLQPICKNFTKLIVRRVNINVYFKLKDPFIHCSFTQRNSHLFYNKYSSITNVHYKIYPNAKFYRHLLERLQQRFLKKKGKWLVATFPILRDGNWYRSNSRLYCLQKVQVFYLDIQVMGLLITPQLHYRWTKSLLSSLFYATNRSRGYHMFSA